MSDDETKIVLAIVGSRDCKDRERVYSEINTWIAANGKPSEIVSGGATGVDSLAAAYANEHKIPLVVFARLIGSNMVEQPVL
jgi:predicted Rossmann fold nucleotide-binding protein DprA/Smf involved in DNA uptake